MSFGFIPSLIPINSFIAASPTDSSLLPISRPVFSSSLLSRKTSLALTFMFSTEAGFIFLFVPPSKLNSNSGKYIPFFFMLGFTPSKLLSTLPPAASIISNLMSDISVPDTTDPSASARLDSYLASTLLNFNSSILVLSIPVTCDIKVPLAGSYVLNIS